jgi:phosphotransferase system enzyme I (PtsP)
MALIGLGYRSLSMAPAGIGPVKAMTIALDAGKLATLLNGLLDSDDGSAALRPALTAFAESEGIPY